MSKIQALLQKIDNKIHDLKARRPLSTGEIQELRKSLGVYFTYASTAIEGNTLTLGETKLVLEDGITVGGKSLREMHEVSNHKELLEILYNFLEQGNDIDEELIKNIHAGVMKHIDDDSAGVYRRIQNYISGEDSHPPKAKEVPGLMQDLCIWYNTEKNTSHPALLAAEFHYKFVKIHPFLDGNGRTIRLLINMILMKHAYPMIIIPPVRRHEYIQTLHSSSLKESFIEFFLDVVDVNIEDYLRMIEMPEQ